MNRQRHLFRNGLTFLMGLCLPLFAFESQAGSAPGAPGAPSVWASADKSFLGTSASPTSRVYFTGVRGIVTEVFYPTVDQVQTVDLQFLVGDTGRTWVDEEKLQQYSVNRPNPRSLSWQVVTSNPAHDWKITKRIFTDPARNALIQRVTFDALNGKNVSQFNLYVLHNPSVNNSGGNDASKTVSSQGKTWLVATESNRAAALGISLPWKNGMASNGFVGSSDGWTDLLGSAADKQMNWNYDSAGNGNVAQMGWVDFGASTATSVQFDVVLGFGSTETEASTVVAAALNGNTAASETAYSDEWLAYTGGLDNQGGLADDEYYLAAMVLKSSQDKSNGAIVAGLGTPWGETNGDGNNHGYHLVWSRDLFKFANALINAGDRNTANKAVDFLFNVQMDPSTGRFPQNSWVNGQPVWNATQMDEQAMPIILAWRLNRNDLWPKIQKTAKYIMDTGPRTEQDRWEENDGYSPSTMAAEIAGLICAAEIAQANGDTTKASAYRAKADEWRSQVDNTTFTTTGSYGNGRYYLRITKNADPNDGDNIDLKNGGGRHDERAIVDGGFLELVRMGVKSPDDPSITDSLPEYDAVLKQTIPGKGDAWFRYNCDGYGERNDGSNYRDDRGIGRLWPIFTAERGMYEIHKAKNGNVGKPYLDMLKAFAGETGMISEQVWNNPAKVGGCDVVTPPQYAPGTATKSIRPLNWAMGEYINLLASVKANKIVDVPEVVCERYGTCGPPKKCPNNQSVYIDPSKAIAGQPLEICYAGQALVSGSALQVHWGIDAWQAVTDTPMAKKADGAWWATVTPACNAAKLDYVFTNGMGSWDNNNGADWHQSLAAAAPGTCSLVTVNFKVDNAYTVGGQNIYVVGDVPQLGGWNTNQAVKMAPCNYPSWCASIQLPAHTPIQFKFIRRDPVTWETGNNRSLTTLGSGASDYQGGSFHN